MRFQSWLLGVGLGMALFGACNNDETPVQTKTQPGDLEGDDGGECDDGADNDQDGLFDCDDDGCAGSPDCQNEGDADTDADGDSDADTDSDTDTDVNSCVDVDLCDLGTVSFDYTLTWNWDPLLAALCGSGLGDCILPCTTRYLGSGSIVEVDPSTGRATFLGDWQQVSSDCNADTEEVVSEALWTPMDGVAHHTIFMHNPDTLRDWFAHSSPVDYTTQSNQNWFVTEMFTDLDLTVEEPETTWVLMGDPIPNALTSNIDHDLTVTFTKQDP